MQNAFFLDHVGLKKSPAAKAAGAHERRESSQKIYE